MVADLDAGLALGGDGASQRRDGEGGVRLEHAHAELKVNWHRTLERNAPHYRLGNGTASKVDALGNLEGGGGA